MPLIYPDINGFRYSYASIITSVNGIPIVGFKSLNYKSPVEEGEAYGTSARRVGRTRGKVTHSGDCEIFEEEWHAFLRAQTTRGGFLGIAEGTCTMTVSYSEPSNFDLTHTDVLMGVRFMGPEKSRSEGTDALTVKFNLSIMEILYHGAVVLR
jgi:hypothetical protein